jgi:Tfp pilus assembly protein PilX
LAEHGILDALFFDAEAALREAEGWLGYYSRLASTGAWPPERPRPRPRPNTLAEARVQWRTAYTRHYDLAEHGLLDALFFDAEAALREADGWLAHFERLAASPPATGLRK